MVNPAPLRPAADSRTDENAFSATAILAALADPVVVVDSLGLVRFVNVSAQEFFDISAALIAGQPIAALLGADSLIMELIAQVQAAGASVAQNEVPLDGPRYSRRLVSVKASALAADIGLDGEPGEIAGVVLVLHELTMARRMDGQLSHRSAARSVVAMAAMLAHEVKNPLSGIRGAAQLLEQNANAADRELTRLICDETDRIVSLVDRMEVFSDSRPIVHAPVNIHDVLAHVRKLAQSGFARNVHFIERYDPSLPPVAGNRDQLVQVFLNLIKNAAEAVPQTGGEIIISTAYQHGVRFAGADGEGPVALPLVVSVQDNGGGIPEDMQPHLFEAFITSKINGSGLGLALVAKIIGDHGGVIEVDSKPRHTVFRVALPLMQNLSPLLSKRSNP